MAENNNYIGINVDSKKICSIDEYNNLFKPNKNSREATQMTELNKKCEALKMALDTRKFEIELYWKRATYFWAFIALAFGAFFCF